MQEALSTNIKPLDIYYLGRDLSQKSKLREQINLRPFLEKLGCKIIRESPSDINLAPYQNTSNPFVVIKAEKDFQIILPAGCYMELERFLLALGLSHFILHGQTGRKPCFISNFSAGKVGLEAYYFAIGITSKLEEIATAKKQGLNITQISNLFVLPDFAVDVAINGLLEAHDFFNSDK